MDTPLFLYAPENLVSRDEFSRPVPRQSAHSPYSDWIWCSLTTFLPISASGCGRKEVHINWFMLKPAKAAPVTGTTLRFTGPVPAGSRQ